MWLYASAVVPRAQYTLALLILASATISATVRPLSLSLRTSLILEGVTAVQGRPSLDRQSNALVAKSIDPTNVYSDKIGGARA